MTPTATTRAGKPVGRVAFVGAGPGDPGLVTLRARDRLAAADIIVTDSQDRQLNRDELLAGSPPTRCDHRRRRPRRARRRADPRVPRQAAPHRQGARRRRTRRPAPRRRPQPVQRVRRGGAGPAQGGHPVRGRPRRQRASAVAMYAGVPLTTQQATSVHVVDAGDRHHDWAPAVPDHVTVVVLGAPERWRPPSAACSPPARGTPRCR